MKNKKTTVIICSCLLLLVPLLDQLTKYLVRTLMQPGDSVKVLGEFFRLTYVLNDGMAFGKLGGGWRWVFMIITPIALTAIAVFFFKKFKDLHVLTAASLTMIFAGGFSNMIDRIFFFHLDPASTGLFDGRVIDFFDFNITLFGHRIWNAVFNVADAFVVVGVFILLIRIIYSDIQDRKKKKAAAAAAAPEHTSSFDPAAEVTGDGDGGDAAAGEPDTAEGGEDGGDGGDGGGDGE